jgi:hypothetical protein
MVGKNRDCLNDDFSDFGVDVPSLSLLLLLPRLFIRKKFFSFCGKWLLDGPLRPRFDDIVMPVKIRFSGDRGVEEFADEPNICVIRPGRRL